MIRKQMLLFVIFAGKPLQQALLTLQCTPGGASVILSPVHDPREVPYTRQPTPNRLFRQILGGLTVSAVEGSHRCLLSDDTLKKLEDTAPSWCAELKARVQEASKLKDSSVEEKPALNDGEPPTAAETPPRLQQCQSRTKDRREKR